MFAKKQNKRARSKSPINRQSIENSASFAEFSQSIITQGARDDASFLGYSQMMVDQDRSSTMRPDANISIAQKMRDKRR